MKIVVISLPKSQNRRSKLEVELGRKNIAFEFLDAVDGKTDHHPYLQNYNEKKFLLHCRRKAAPGELGCYVSHLLAWEKCIALNEPIVVLEDDFELTDNFTEGLVFLEQFLDKVPFIRLEKLESGLYWPTSCKNETFRLVKQLKVGMCMTGYVITPQCARVLLDKGREIRTPVDLYLRYTLIHKQLIFALIPHVVNPTHAESIIGLGLRRRREKGLKLKIRRFLNRWTYAVGSLVVNLANALSRH